MSRSYRVFFIYLIAIFLIQIFSEVWSYLYKTNLFVSHYYFITQYILLSIFYSTVIKNLVYKKGILLSLFLVPIPLILQYVYNPEKYHMFNLTEIVVCSLPIVLHSIIYFFQSISKEKKEFLYINSGIFTYLLCSTLIFVAGNYVSPVYTFWYRFIWYLNAFLIIIFQSLIFIEWYKHFRKKKESTEIAT